MNAVEVLTPASLAELRTALAGSTGTTRLVAGGTDLMLALQDLRPDRLIDLSGVHELSYVRAEEGLIRIGATTTFATLCGDATLGAFAPCLVRAAAEIGSVQIRNVATIGGNVANAAACADALTALLALGAVVRVLNGAGEIEERPLTAVLSPAGGTALAADEAIVGFSFAPVTARQRSAFAKIGSRSSMTTAKLNAAIVATLDDSGETIVDATIAFGAVAPTAFVDSMVAEALCGRVGKGSAERFAAACAQMVSRAIPERGSLPYKRAAVVGLAFDLWSAMRLDRKI